MSSQDTVKSSFTQCPNVLLYGRPDLSTQEKWALIALMGMCWDRGQGRTLKDLEGPYKLSLREIAIITGVDYTSLRSREGKAPRLGILDHLQTVEYVTVIEAKPIDPITKKEGRLQTYLYIHLEKIWKDNIAFTEAWNKPASRLIHPSTFNQISGITVDTTNVIVDQNNSIVANVNNDVDRNNHTVGNVSSKVDTRQSNTINTNSNTDRSDQSIYSAEEKQILDWYERLGTGYTPKPETAKKSLPMLIEHVHSFEDMQSLYDFTAKKITGEDKTVYLANMTKFIKMWLKNKPVVETPQPEMPELTIEESEELVLWTTKPSTRDKRIAQGLIAVEDHFDILSKMLRSDARDFYYDVLGAQHYTKEDEAKYEQWLAEKQGVQSLKIAG